MSILQITLKGNNTPQYFSGLSDTIIRQCHESMRNKEEFICLEDSHGNHTATFLVSEIAFMKTTSADDIKRVAQYQLPR